jgi:hypothetical protein
MLKNKNMESKAQAAKPVVKMIPVQIEILQAIVDYLGKQPYAQVEMLMGAIRKSVQDSITPAPSMVEKIPGPKHDVVAEKLQ